jgi:hypothetical protein
MKAELFKDVLSGATFSDCRKYRYALWRIWEPEKPLVMFIGLNPSTANETNPDRTIESVIRITENWNCGGLYMVNLFAIISKDPEILLTCDDPQGDNDGWIERISAKCERVVFAWGAFKESKKRCSEIIDKFPDAYCLQLLKDGSPRHPLYMKGTTVPFLFNQSHKSQHI